MTVEKSKASPFLFAVLSSSLPRHSSNDSYQGEFCVHGLLGHRLSLTTMIGQHGANGCLTQTARTKASMIVP